MCNSIRVSARSLMSNVLRSCLLKIVIACMIHLMLGFLQSTVNTTTVMCMSHCVPSKGVDSYVFACFVSRSYPLLKYWARLTSVHCKGLNSAMK